MSATTLHIQNRKLVSEADQFDYQWQHFDLNEDQGATILADTSLPHFARLGLTTRESRPRVVIDDELILIVLRGANLNESADTDDMISLRIVATPNRLITAQYRPLKTIDEYLEKSQAGRPEASVSALLAKIIGTLFARIEESVLKLSDKVDELEENIDSDDSGTTREEIADLRRSVVAFKRHLAPQRDVASQLRYANVSWMESKYTAQHAENYERIMRNIDELDELKDKLTIAKEEVQTIQSERLNRNTYVLSVVAAIFLPLGFLTGLLGINVAGMPGADYPPAFWIFCGLLVLVVGIQIYIMRKNDWF